MSTLSVHPSVKEFCRLVQEGLNSWVQAGEVLNTLIEADPSVRGRIMSQHPWMTKDVLDGFERIGRKEIYPNLLLDRSIGAQKLIRLPYSDQVRLCQAEIPVAVRRRGEIVHERRKLQDLSPKEASLAFGEMALRPLAEQRRMLVPKPQIRQSARTPEYSAPSAFAHEPDEATAEETADDSGDGAFPVNDSVEAQLNTAQNALLRARELLNERQKPLDRYLTTALTATGKMRFEIKEQAAEG